MPSTLHLLCVVAARPNLMKMAALVCAFRQYPGITLTLLHTGQHYDDALNGQHFSDLDLPAPTFNLAVGSGSHTYQTAQVMLGFEPVLQATQPDAVLVVGDVNSTLACALVAAKEHIPVVHVEAGLRSHDRAMPEEINRILTDQLSDLLFTTEPDARENLRREGIEPHRIHFVGNVMIDTLHHQLERAIPIRQQLLDIGQTDFLNHSDGYGLVTLHRPSNVDDPILFKRLLDAIEKCSRTLPLIFPMHPRTRSMFARLQQIPVAGDRLLFMPPLPYLKMLGLLKGARIVLTDSGGLQEEATALGIPCLTLRDNTERPVTVTHGSNTIAGTDPARIVALFESTMSKGAASGAVPPLWDGNAATRLAAIVASHWQIAGATSSALQQ